MVDVCFINGQSDRKWIECLREAVNSLRKSLVMVDYHRLQDDYRNCELVILDAGAIDDDLISIVERIHTSNSCARIVVVSSTPHWREARETLLAGATDYVRKASDRRGILDILLGNVTTILNCRNTTDLNTGERSS